MRVAALILALVTLAAGWSQAQEPLQFYATFVGPDGQPLANVSAADVEVKENDGVAAVTRVERVDWPIRVELMLDNGAGVGADNLIHLRNGLRGFIEAMPPGVEASIITLAPQPRTMIRATADRDALLKGSALLTPDAGAGRILDALIESADRINKSHGDKAGGRYFPVVVALASTGAQGRSPVDRVVEEMLQRFGEHAATVHVIMLSSTVSSLGGGANQTRVGLAVTELTGGRYENIAAPQRIETLLPELGKQVAASHAKQLQQFRVIAQRPAGVSGPLGRVTVRARGAAKANLSLDGHLP